MEFSPETLDLLRDEAYLFLCREAVQEKLDALASEKAALADSRPPFGIFVRKQTRDLFTRSMRTALETEAALQDRLAKISALENWVQPRLRADIVRYMQSASEEFRLFPEIQRLLDLWEVELAALPEVLTAFVRELRGLREEAGRGAATPRDLSDKFTMLREIAGTMENVCIRLARIAHDINFQAARVSAPDLTVPTLPNLQRATWVGRLAVLPAEQLVNEALRVESELRTFLQGGYELARVRLSATREQCLARQENFLKAYWNQLRAHARIHYVEERDLDEVIASLTETYTAAASVAIAEQRARATFDPFLLER